MPDLVATLTGTVAAFVAGGAYYAALGDRLGGADAEMPAWKVAVEVARCLLLAAVVAGLVTQTDIETWTQGLLLGLALWAGFPLVLWVGAVVHEGTPVKRAAIHGGDWLVKLLLVGALTAAV